MICLPVLLRNTENLDGPIDFKFQVNKEVTVNMMPVRSLSGSKTILLVFAAHVWAGRAIWD